MATINSRSWGCNKLRNIIRTDYMDHTTKLDGFLGLGRIQESLTLDTSRWCGTCAHTDVNLGLLVTIRAMDM